ncbi:hypothetical protein GCM10022267_75430 [Lentzea roselyniae]|uniref:Uncharacterized protein n=1 Tax=Lentzea roselyniae TaxID=531940 RepID=A0ABP7C5W4_9PSEU
MNAMDAPAHDDQLTDDDFPTLCSIPLRHCWTDESGLFEPVIVRGTD